MERFLACPIGSSFGYLVPRDWLEVLPIDIFLSPLPKKLSVKVFVEPFFSSPFFFLKLFSRLAIKSETVGRWPASICWTGGVALIV